MARKVKRKEREAFKLYVREVADAMGLGGWVFWFTFTPDLDVSMRTHWHTEYLEATFEYGERILRWPGLDADDVRRTVVHEMVHLIHGHVDDQLTDLTDRLGNEAQQIVTEVNRRKVEDHVERVARLLAPSMPEYQPFAH